MHGSARAGSDRRRRVWRPSTAVTRCARPSSWTTSVKTARKKRRLWIGFIAAADDNGDGVIRLRRFAAARRGSDARRHGRGAYHWRWRGRHRRGEAPKRRRRTGGGDGGVSGMDGRKPPGERFDSMRRTCLEWEALLGCAPLPAGRRRSISRSATSVRLEQQEALVDGRLLVVLQSPLGDREVRAGDRRAQIPEGASSLRLGGDLIFKLLSKVRRREGQ